MTNGALITVTGKQIIMDRAFNSVVTRTRPDRYALSVNNGTPLVTDVDLDAVVPITNGTINFRCNAAFTGSGGGDNSTDNTTTYKPDGVSTDNKAQNLIANSSSATKTWLIATLDTNFTAAYYAGFWLYVKDSTTLAKLKSSGTCLEARFRSDASNYYSKTWTTTDLVVLWNWLPAGVISALTATGSPGTLDEFALIATTNNATDTFAAGDVVVDVVRTWQSTDLTKDITNTTLDEDTLEAALRGDITTTEAVGFAINGVALKNSDGDLFSETTFNEKSKGTSDEFVIITRVRHA